MKRLRSLIALWALVAVLGCLASMAGANGVGSIYPFPFINKTSYQQYEVLQMYQGWYDSELVWFIRTDTDLIRGAFDFYSDYTVYWQGMTFAPKLAEAADDVARVYFVINNRQGPLFTAIPGDATYSGLWRGTLILFHDDVTPHPITNTDPYDPVNNPSGLPPVSDADFFDTDLFGRAIVAKLPIMAVGPLDGPWLPAPDGRYRIPQGKVDYNYTYTKQIWLPFWYVYCQNPITKHVDIRRVIVPDAWDPADVPDPDKIVPKIGANDAPGLAIIPDAARQDFFYMNGPKPWSQYPVLAACPSDPYYPWRNTNFDYSPVMTYTVLDRLIPPYAVINNLTAIDMLLGNGRLVTAREDQVINAPVLPELPFPP